MARKRMIDPDIWTDARFAFLSDAAKVLYIGMISQADDEGRIELSPEQFSLRICAGKRPSEVAESLVEVLESRLVLAYENAGSFYGYHPKWNEYQKVSHPTKSRFPAQTDPDSRELSGDFAKFLENSGILQKTRERSRNVRPRSDQVRSDRDRLGEVGKPSLPDAPTFGDLEPDVCAYLANAAGENKSGKISAGRELSLRRELVEIRDLFGDAVFAEALRETNAKGVPNRNYVKRVAESLQRRGVRPNLSPVPSVKPIHAYADGRMVEFVRGSADEPKSWTDTPPRGLRRHEVWPEHRHMVFGDDEGVA